MPGGGEFTASCVPCPQSGLPPATDPVMYPRDIDYLKAILESATHHGLLVTDNSGVIRLHNSAAAAIFHYRRDELVGLDAGVLFTPEDREQRAPHREMVACLANGCAADFRWHLRKDGSRFWADGMIYPLRSANGTHQGYVKILRDATEDKHRVEEFERMALTDSLTELANRAEFEASLAYAVEKARRSGARLIVQMIDLDRFKAVNDRLGHAAGDSLLQQAAARMRDTVRGADLLARVGGDEFALLQTDVTDAEVGGVVADKVIQALSEPFEIEGEQVSIGASVGISVCPDDADHAEQLMRNADRALYQVKEEGRNTYRYFTPELDEAAHRRQHELATLERAIDEQALALEFQPLVDRDGVPLGVEALLRCTAPGWKDEPIERLLELAGSAGQRVRLTHWVIGQAASHLQRWQRDRWPGLKLTLNLWSEDLDTAAVLEQLRDAIGAAGLDMRDLDFDIPERQFDLARHTGVLSALQGIGSGTTLDDFGSGHLSLLALSDAPLDRVKLDMRFVPDIGCSRRSQAIAASVRGVAHAYGWKAVAEHVESAAEADFLRREGWDAMQGHHFGAPMPADEMDAWLHARER